MWVDSSLPLEAARLQSRAPLGSCPHQWVWGSVQQREVLVEPDPPPREGPEVFRERSQLGCYCLAVGSLTPGAQGLRLLEGFGDAAAICPPRLKGETHGVLKLDFFKLLFSSCPFFSSKTQGWHCDSKKGKILVYLIMSPNIF